MSRLVASSDHLNVEDLAPRIKEPRCHIEELEARHSSFDSTKEASLRLTREEVRSQVRDFEQVLLGGSFLERKRFLRSFIRRVVIPHQGDHENGEMEYTLPLVPQRPGVDRTLSNFEVLSTVQVGSPYRSIRVGRSPFKTA